MSHRIVFMDGERELSAFSWDLGLESAILVAPQFMGICGASSGRVLDDEGEEVWAHVCRDPFD